MRFCGEGGMLQGCVPCVSRAGSTWFGTCITPVLETHGTWPTCRLLVAYLSLTCHILVEECEGVREGLKEGGGDW